MNNILILITSSFPFQNGEEFLLRETKYYGDFKKVFIIPIAARDFSKKKPLSDEFVVYRLTSILTEKPIKKIIKCLQALGYSETIDEIKFLKQTKRLSFKSLKRVLIESKKIEAISGEIDNIVGKIYKENENENILVYSYWMGNHAKIAVNLKKCYPKLKIVTRCHGGDLYEYRYKSNYIPFRRSILENEDMIFTISDDGKRYLEENYHNIHAPIFVSRLGTIRIHERKKVNNKNGINIVSCSYCIPLKRIQLIIKALSKVSTCDITWTHIGNGIEYENLKRYAAENIPSNVKFNFMGYVENIKVQELYSAGNFNLFINVSETEGIPVSIMEAMSYGIPIIATDVGGVSEMVENGINGFLMPKDFDAAELNKLIEKMRVMNSFDYEHMSEESYKIWDIKFNAEKNYPDFVKSLRKV